MAQGQDNNTPKGVEFHVDTPDSVLQASIVRFQLQPLQVKIEEYENPQFDPTGAQFHNPLDAFNGSYYLGVTELGHPHLDLFRDYSGSIALGYRPTSCPAFYKQPNNVSFYQVKKPYTLLAYHSSLKKDYQLHVTHTQNIRPRWNMALDYHLFSPQGTFTNSSASDHLLDFNTNYYSRDARYLLAAGIIWQRMNMGENWGLAADSVYTQQIVSTESGIPVNESLRHSLTRDLTLYAHQSYNTVRQFQWTRPRKQSVADNAGRLHDTIVGYDTVQPYTPRVLNSGLFALDIQYDKQQYRYVDSTRYQHLTARLYWTNDAYMDSRWRNPCKLTLGIRPETEKLELLDSVSAPLTSVMLITFAQADLAINERTGLSLLGETSIATQEYNLNAGLTRRLGSDSTQRKFSLQANVATNGSDIIYNLLMADADVSLRYIDTRRISAQYEGRWIDLFVAGNHIAHNIWLDQQRQTVQSQTGAYLLQARLTGRFAIGSHLHLDMQQLAQYSSDQDQIRVPLFASKNSVYADFNLFHGALRTQVGADLRYHTRFYADGYDPSLAMFYRQDEVEVGNYLYGDLFVNMQIKRASIYIKAGHLNSLFEQQSYCILPHYPMRGFGVYYGLIWQFFD